MTDAEIRDREIETLFSRVEYLEKLTNRLVEYVEAITPTIVKMKGGGNCEKQTTADP